MVVSWLYRISTACALIHRPALAVSTHCVLRLFTVISLLFTQLLLTPTTSAECVFILWVDSKEELEEQECQLQPAPSKDGTPQLPKKRRLKATEKKAAAMYITEKPQKKRKKDAKPKVKKAAEIAAADKVSGGDVQATTEKPQPRKPDAKVKKAAEIAAADEISATILSTLLKPASCSHCKELEATVAEMAANVDNMKAAIQAKKTPRLKSKAEETRSSSNSWKSLGASLLSPSKVNKYLVDKDYQNFFY